jgi:predicted transcriptional regulator
VVILIGLLYKQSIEKKVILISQDIVYNFLKNSNKWHSSNELSQKLGITRNSINSNLKKLVKFDTIKLKKVMCDNRHKKYLYRCDK